MEAVRVPADDPLADAWREVIRLSGRAEWTLVGGLMIHTFQHQRGQQPTRLTEDIDTLHRVTSAPKQPEAFVEMLVDDGYRIDDDDIHDLGDGTAMAHRFRRGSLVVDVIVPGDGRAPRRTAHTVDRAKPAAAVGGEYALQRSEVVHVSIGASGGPVRRPDLLGALLIKSRAAVSDKTTRGPRHGEDLATLYACVDDPIELRRAASLKQLRYLRRAQASIRWPVDDLGGRQAADIVLAM